MSLASQMFPHLRGGDLPITYNLAPPRSWQQSLGSRKMQALDSSALPKAPQQQPPAALEDKPEEERAPAAIEDKPRAEDPAAAAAPKEGEEPAKPPKAAESMNLIAQRIREAREHVQADRAEKSQAWGDIHPAKAR